MAIYKIADYYKVGKRKIISIEYLKEIGGSALTDHSIEVPKKGMISDCIPVTYVPFRNSHILAIAVSLAEVEKASIIFIGAVHEDSSGYPDCRPEYYKTFNQLIKVGTKNEIPIKILTPLIKLSKAEIIKKGIDLKAPIQFTWSCYDREDIACGLCESCTLRLKGFKDLNKDDPIKYSDK